MSSLTSIEKRYFEDLLNLGTGYVLDFSNATFDEFFRENNIAIYSEKYSYNGNSKANRLRTFWETDSDQIVGKVLGQLLEIWQYNNTHPDEQSQRRYDKAVEITHRLQGKKQEIKSEEDAATFLKQNFELSNLSKITMETSLLPVIKSRLDEVQKCMTANAPLSVIFLSGSILEGILLSIASQNPRIFNQANSAPKDNKDTVKPFHNWSLAQFIDVAHECEFLKLDVKKFSHGLRDFRNYIHPFEQARSGFQPTMETAELCFQVLKAAIADLSGGRK